MSYKELLKQVGITTVAVATATVAVYVGREQWDKYQARKSPPRPPPPPPSPYGVPVPPSSSPTLPQKKLPTGGSLENSPCSEQTTAFLDCAFHHSADLLKCAQLAEGLKSCRKLYKLEPEGAGSWLPWKS